MHSWSTPLKRQQGLTDAATWAAARSPLLVACLGAVLLLLVGAASVPSAVAAFLLVGAGAIAQRLTARRHARECDQLRAEAQREQARLTSLCSVSAPLWIRQIETVRGDADNEVAELTRTFGHITRKLDKVLAPGILEGASGPDDILAALAGNGADLDRLVEALKSLQASKERIVAEIGTQAAQLKENAAEIRQIALHTRMVALNATIEAARAGAAGKPFSVIVADMRELAARTAEASEQFSRHTDRLHGMISAAFREQASGERDAVSIAWAQELVSKVVESFESVVAQLTRSIELMGRERRDVRDDIGRVLVALQFQDRVSQILSHITGNLQEMQRHIETGRWQTMDTRQWIEHMAAPYSMQQEFDNLSQQRPQPAHVDSEVTYF